MGVQRLSEVAFRSLTNQFFKMKSKTSYALLLLVTGCASSGIMKTGDDRFLVSKTSLQVGFGAPTAVYAEITNEAVAFCKGQSKEMEVVRTDIQHPALGKPGSATLEFRCKQRAQ